MVNNVLFLWESVPQTLSKKKEAIKVISLMLEAKTPHVNFKFSKRGRFFIVANKRYLRENLKDLIPQIIEGLNILVLRMPTIVEMRIATAASIDVQLKISQVPFIRNDYLSHYLSLLFIILIILIFIQNYSLSLTQILLNDGRLIITIFDSIKRVYLNLIELSAFKLNRLLPLKISLALLCSN